MTDAAPAVPGAQPAALDTLPRTGSRAGDVTVLGGFLLVVGGLAFLAGRRRRGEAANASR